MRERPRRRVRDRIQKSPALNSDHCHKTDLINACTLVDLRSGDDDSKITGGNKTRLSRLQHDVRNELVSRGSLFDQDWLHSRRSFSIAVSPDNINASGPSRTAFTASDASARVGHARHRFEHLRREDDWLRMPQRGSDDLLLEMWHLLNQMADNVASPI